MFCEKCGAQLPDGSQFCEQCGAATTTEAAAATATAAATAAATAYQPATPAGPSPIKKFFSNKRNVGILAAILAVIIVAVVAIIIVANQPPKAKTIYLDEYFTVTVQGPDGYATAEVEWDREQMYELSKDIFSLESYDSESEFLESTDGKFYEYTVSGYIDIVLSKTEGISNGDEIEITLAPAISTLGDGSEFTIEALEKQYNVKFKLKEGTITAAELQPVVAFDPFEHVTFEFVGVDGYGEMNVVVPEDRIAIDETYSFGFESYWGSFSVELYENGSYVYSVSYTWDTDSDNALKNGDTVTVSISEHFDADSERRLAGYGFVMATKEKSVTVSGLTAVTEYAPADNLALTFDGYNGYGTLGMGFVSEEVTVGDYTLRFVDDSSSWTAQFYIEIVNAEGNTLRTIYYDADKKNELTNDDVITFDTYTDVEYVMTEYGVLFPEEFTVTVTGLVDPLTPDILANATISFSGYNKYGVMNFFFPAEADKQTFTLGDYTFKLTPSTTDGYSGNTYKITVVVANAAGENIISLNYTCYDTYSLENGDECKFSCNLWSSNRSNYLDTYGINFPESFTYIVSDLPEATETDPRQYATYSFSGTDGEITLTLGLSQTSYTVNGYTINLSVAAGQGYSWSPESRLIFTIVDAAGTEVSSGYYSIDESGLSEGDTLYFYSRISNNNGITAATGIIFNTESKSVIVSAK